MKRTLLLLILICVSFVAFGQIEETAVEADSQRNLKERKEALAQQTSSTIYVEFGFNAASILQSIPVLPVGRSGIPSYAFFIKRKKQGKNRQFRFHVVGSLGGEELSFTNFEMKLGTEYPRTLTKGWEYYYGYDFITFIQDQASGAGIGFGPIFGMKYNLNDFITFGTEGSGYLTISGGNNSNGTTFNIRPLNGIFISFKLYK